MTRQHPLVPGDEAPAFTLEAHDGARVGLADSGASRGHVLYFMRAFT